MIKSLPSLIEAETTIRQTANAVQKRNNALKEEISALEGEGRTPDWTKNAVRKAREKAVSDAGPDMEKLKTAHEFIKRHSDFWQDKDAVLSRLSLTETGADAVSPANPHLEQVAVQTAIQRASLLSEPRLQAEVRHLAAEGRIAEAHLFASVGHSKGFNVDTATLDVPLRTRALEALNASTTTASLAIADFQEINGKSRHETLISRLNAARGTL